MPTNLADVIGWRGRENAPASSGWRQIDATKHSGTIETVKDRIVAAIKESGGIVKATCLFGLSVPAALHALRLDPKIQAGPVTRLHGQVI